MITSCFSWGFNISVTKDGVITGSQYTDAPIKQPPIKQPALSRAAQNTLETILDYLNTPTDAIHRLPLSLKQSTFRTQVYNQLREIPLGTTCTYGELAQKLNTHARAIGQACRHNPIPLVIPCHRVVAQGHVGGFNGATSGQMISIKNALLAHERHASRVL